MTMAGFTANAQLIVDSLGRVGIGTPSQYGYTMSAYSDHQGIKSVSNTNTSDTESVGFTGMTRMILHGITLLTRRSETVITW